MCGILGVFSKGGLPDFSKAEGSLQKIRHRGPDGQYCEKIAENLIFGHARLSIIDLSDVSNQPMHIDDGAYSIVYNGEIFNYIELRDELISLGYSFHTNGDTEVLLRAYAHFGEACLHKLNGMWAFAIYDRSNDTVFCSRDRYGIKPFVYSNTEKGFIFASEAKAIVHYLDNEITPNYQRIANYVRNSYGAQGEETWFNEIKRLLPGHAIKYNGSGFSTWQYYTYPEETVVLNETEAQEKYRDLFIDAVKLRMRSDVPVGTTLSSGVDSSSIVTALRTFFKGTHHSYTAYFANNIARAGIYKGLDQIKEEDTVKLIEKDLDLDSAYVLVGNDDYLNRLRSLVYALDGGHSSTAIVPIEKVYERAKKDVTVVLEGQGADELMGGYITTVIFEAIWLDITRGNIRAAWANLRIFLRSYTFMSAFLMLIRTSLPNWLLQLVYYFRTENAVLADKLKGSSFISDSPLRAPNGYSILKKKLFHSYTGVLVDLMHYGDILTMMHGLEGRHPFMDHRLVEFVFSLKPNYLVKNGEGKMLHKDAMRELLPGYILKNVHKVGFSTPIYDLFSPEDSFGVLNYIRKHNRPELFRSDLIEKLILQTQTQEKDNTRILFRIVSTLLFFDHYLPQKNA
jgi:asparagine synthase (glutamine-hydrolysing)